MMKAVRLFSSWDNWECQCFWWTVVCHSRPNLICPKQWGHPTCYTVGQNPVVISNAVWGVVETHLALLPGSSCRRSRAAVEGLRDCSECHVCCVVLGWHFPVPGGVGGRQGSTSPLGRSWLCLCVVTHPWARGWMSACPATVLPLLHSALGGAPWCFHSTQTHSPRSPPGTCTWEGIGILAVALNKLVPGATYCCSEGIFREHPWLQLILCLCLLWSVLVCGAAWWLLAWCGGLLLAGPGVSSVCFAGPLNKGYVQLMVPKCGCWSPEIHRTRLSVGEKAQHKCKGCYSRSREAVLWRPH